MMIGVMVGCASAPDSNAESEAVSAADAAVAAMNGTRTSSSQSAKTSQGKEPAWVSAPDTVYPRNSFVAAVGYGADRNLAERNALASLTAVFGQSIQAELKTVNNYSEAISRGDIQVSENTSIQNAIKTSSEMDCLIGAEIKDIWFDSKSIYYAVAVLEKALTSSLYQDLIKSNQRIINELVTMSNTEKYSLDGYSRYQLAATIADANRVYANVLTIVGNSSDIVPGDLKKGDDYRVEAVNITKNIPIAVIVDNDRSNRIKDAFAGVLNKQGFRSGGTNPRYVLNISVTFSPVDLPNQQNKFTRYVIDANLTDTQEESVLLPFNINGREGHLSISEAENRAVMAAERKITDMYGIALSDYLSKLLPKK
jgi:hypothetical protein